MTRHDKGTSSAWAVFRRQIWVGLFVAIAIITVPLLTHGVEISETRLYRELMGRMPFSRVKVIGQHVEGGEISVWGTMVKRRCEWRGLSAYVERDGIWLRAWVDTSAEDRQRPSGDRPPAGDPQAWGPWSIRIVPPAPKPTRWRIFAHHQCPRGPQTNLFTEGDWHDV